jgi:hypothetical protein
VSRREEWQQQMKLAALLDKWLPDDAFWTAFDPVAGSPTSGLMRKRRGIRPGLPDTWVLHRGRSVTIEMKSRHGRCSPSQRATRLLILAAEGACWEAKSVNAAMVALHRSRVQFRTITHADGRIERWRQPKLADWETPRRVRANRDVERRRRRRWRPGTGRRPRAGGSGSARGRSRGWKRNPLRPHSTRSRR